MRRPALAFVLVIAFVGAAIYWLGDAVRPPPPVDAPETGTSGTRGDASAPAAPATVTESSAPDRGGPRILGRVRSAAGAPLAGAQVLASAPKERATLRRATTDAEGRFALAADGASRWVVSAEAPGFVPKTLQDVAPGETVLDVVLAPRGSLEISVLDAEGTPIAAEASVEARFAGSSIGGPGAAPEVPDGAPRKHVGASPDGVVRFAGLAAGLWRVEATVPGDPPRVLGSAPVEVHVSDGVATPVPLHLVRAGRIEGRVVDGKTGEPVGLVQLSLRLPGEASTGGLRQANAAASADGRFVADGLAAGEWSVVGKTAAGTWVREKVPVARGEVVSRDVPAKATGSLRVRAREESGAPVAGVVIEFAAEDGSWGVLQTPTPHETDADGYVTFSAALPGSVRVSSRANDRYAASGSVLVEVVPGGTTEAEVMVPRAPPTARPRR